jgi:hypothetical protein
MGAEDDDGNFASGKTSKLEVNKLITNNATSGTVTAEIKAGETSVTVNTTNNTIPPKLTDAQANATVKAPSFSRNKKTTSSNDLGI